MGKNESEEKGTAPATQWADLWDNFLIDLLERER